MNILQKKWCSISQGNDFSFSFQDYQQALVSLRLTTNVAKYRSFQFRLLLNAIITNKHLHAWGIKSSNLCYFCNMHIETVSHLFCDCTIIKDFWLHVWEEIKDRFPTTEEICTSRENIILNSIIDNPKHVYNLFV